MSKKVKILVNLTESLIISDNKEIKIFVQYKSYSNYNYNSNRLILKIQYLIDLYLKKSILKGILKSTNPFNSYYKSNNSY